MRELPHEDETNLRYAGSCYWNEHKFISDVGFYEINAGIIVDF